MQEPIKPITEDERLKVLMDLLILDTPIDEAYDSIVRYTATQFAVKIVMIAFMDADRNWFKSCSVDLGTRESPRNISFCGHTILQPDLFEVTDTHLDERFSGNPLVSSGPKVRYYAGVPLFVKRQPIGTLCLFDDVPHESMAADKRDHLKALAKLLETQLSWI
jgi:GAF domain-containing protein